MVINADYKAFIRGAAGKARYDIAFIDPPYALNIAEDALLRLLRADMLATGALVIVESDKTEPICAEGLTVRRHARYGKVYITLLEKQAEDEV